MSRKFSRSNARVQKEPVNYILKEDEGKENPLTFKLQPLSKRQLMVYQDKSSKMDVFNNVILLGNSANEYDLFRHYVVGVENLYIDDELYKFKRENGLVDEELMEILPLDIIKEVALEILKLSNPSEEELGK